MNEKDKSIYTMNPEGGWCPTKEQGLLLRASILQGKEAIEALQEWKANINIAHLDHGSQRLLPLLYHNLRSQGIDDSFMNRFKGVYRLTWYKNQLLFHHVTNLLQSFYNDGIQTMVLKGAALSIFYYRDYGLRPMADFDILVQSEQASAAINLIIKSGWKPKHQKLLENFPEIYFSAINAFHFESTNRCELDLHWHLLRECCYPGADDDFWENAVSANIHDVSTQILNPTDQLLHVCVHGAEWNPMP
ncbi:nucleotidyltransferase family protein, partial [bacterium]|nr:nucleotidyltransferase family protein [bacterium]